MSVTDCTGHRILNEMQKRVPDRGHGAGKLTRLDSIKCKARNKVLQVADGWHHTDAVAECQHWIVACNNPTGTVTVAVDIHSSETNQWTKQPSE